VKTLVLAAYPAAKIGEPFELGHNMEQIQVTPAGVIVKIARSSGADTGNPPRNFLSHPDAIRNPDPPIGVPGDVHSWNPAQPAFDGF